jgi:nickel superoxide dismutase
MIQRILKFIDKIRPFERVYAHCDVPCGIYESDSMMTAAATMEKMVEKIQALKRPAADASADEWNTYQNSLTRMILEKEEQGEICKRELLILWTDYFKPEHLEEFPDLHEKVWKTAKLVSKCKQSVNMKAIQELKDAVHEVAHMFSEAEEAKKK